jgi:phosphate transport system permease protein
VIYGERIAKWVIIVGGLLVILAVLWNMVFLFQVVLPLMGSGKVVGEVRHSLDAREVAWLNADAFQSLAIRVAANGEATTFHIPTGRVVKQEKFDFVGAVAAAVGGTLARDRVAFGFDDGSVQFGQVGFAMSTTARDDARTDLTRLDERDFLSGERILTPVQTGDFRTVTPVKTMGAPERISDAAIVALDYRVGGTVERPTRSYITVDAEGIARLSRSTIQRNLMDRRRDGTHLHGGAARAQPRHRRHRCAAGQFGGPGHHSDRRRVALSLRHPRPQQPVVGRTPPGFPR